MNKKLIHSEDKIKYIEKILGKPLDYFYYMSQDGRIMIYLESSGEDENNRIKHKFIGYSMHSAVNAAYIYFLNEIKVGTFKKPEE